MTLPGLPTLIRLEGRPVMLLGSGPAAEAKRRLLERAGAVIIGEDAQAALAIVALDGPEEAVARLRARGLLVNAVDRPDLCDFTLPAIVDRAPVLVAISTGGVSAGLAAALRQRLEAVLPAGLGRLAEALHDARADLRTRYPDAGERRRAVAALLAEGGPLDPLRDHHEPSSFFLGVGGSPGETGKSVAAPGRARSDGRVERIFVTSSDPDELTLRAARLLGTAARVIHAPDIPSAILARARADAERVPPPAPPAPGLTVELVWGHR